MWKRHNCKQIKALWENFLGNVILTKKQSLNHHQQRLHMWSTIDYTNTKWERALHSFVIIIVDKSEEATEETEIKKKAFFGVFKPRQETSPLHLVHSLIRKTSLNEMERKTRKEAFDLVKQKDCFCSFIFPFYVHTSHSWFLLLASRYLPFRKKSIRRRMKENS